MSSSEHVSKLTKLLQSVNIDVTSTDHNKIICLVPHRMKIHARTLFRSCGGDVSVFDHESEQNHVQMMVNIPSSNIAEYIRKLSVVMPRAASN